jgi:DNA-binding NtrC family response regulator
MTNSNTTNGTAAERELIMIIDDEQDILRILRMGLTRYNHKIMTFSDPVEALNEFTINRCYYGLIICDLRMPGMSGIELAKKAKDLDPEVKVVIMTAFELSPFETTQDLPYLRIDDVLKKPVSLSSLCKVIEKNISRRLDKK